MISPGERRWLLIFAIIVLLITTIPYLAGYQAQSSEWRFSGFVFGVDDGNTYIAKMLRGSSGDWLFRTPYTAYPQKGFLAFLPYYLLGKLASPPGIHDQLVALFHLFRVLAGFLMIWATYMFVAYFVHEVRLRQAGTMLAVLGGGLGFLQLAGLGWLWGERIPLEFYSPETFGFLSLFGLPHLALARALLLFGLLFFVRGIKMLSLREVALGGILWLLLGFVQPLSVVTAWVVAGIYLLLRLGLNWVQEQKNLRFIIRAGIVVLLISAPMVVYNFTMFMTDPFLRGWGEQNRIFSPPPGDYLLAFGLLLPFVMIGMAHTWQRRGDWLLLAGWVLAFPLLAYAPYNLQRRLPEGIWVALVILAIAGFGQITQKWKKVWAAVFYLSFISTALVFLGAVITVMKPAAPVFQFGDLVEAYQFVGQNAGKDDVVLASFSVSNGLPAYAPVRTITGHGPESVNAKMLNPRVDAFFKAETLDALRIELLREFNVRYYIHFVRDESTWQPDTASFLTLVYANASTQIFEVNLLPE